MNPNEKLIEEHLQAIKSLPDDISESRIKTIKVRLKTVSRLSEYKSFDEFTENDIKNLNRKMKELNMKSASDYRKVLKRYWKLKDKKKFIDLIESVYMQAKRQKNHKEALVNPEDFWNETEISKYLAVCENYTPRMLAWGSLWISTGCRPHELLALRKESLVFDRTNETLIIRVESLKTGKRSIILSGNEATGVWEKIEPYLETLKPSALLFDCCYRNIKKHHEKICKTAGIKKPTFFYLARKARLTRFYNELGLAQASMQAGHIPGSKSMRHYVGMSEQQMLGSLPKIEARACPSCGTQNKAGETACIKCKAPLDPQAFAKIFEKKQNEEKDRVKQMVLAALAEKGL